MCDFQDEVIKSTEASALLPLSWLSLWKPVIIHEHTPTVLLRDVGWGSETFYDLSATWVSHIGTGSSTASQTSRWLKPHTLTTPPWDMHPTKWLSNSWDRKTAWDNNVYYNFKLLSLGVISYAAMDNFYTNSDCYNNHPCLLIFVGLWKSIKSFLEIELLSLKECEF